MYRHSPVRNQRSKGIKIKRAAQVCLLIAVCFWLIFQVKRSHDKKTQFDVNEPEISSSTHAVEVVNFGRKGLQPKLEEQNEIQTQEYEDEEQEEPKHGEEEQDEDKIEEEKDDGGGGGEDEIDDNDLEKSDMEIDREEVDIIDEDNETEEKENDQEIDGQSQTENVVDHDEDGSTEHTHEAREQHYKADDASSAVITHDAENELKNGTIDNNSIENVSLVDNGEAPDSATLIQEKVSDSINHTLSMDTHENGPPSNTALMNSNSTSVGYHNATVTEGPSYTTDIPGTLKSDESTAAIENSTDPSTNENLETTNADFSDATHSEENEIGNFLEQLREIETEDGNSEETAAE